MNLSHLSLNPIKIALFGAFGLLGVVLAYAAFAAPNDIRTRAACGPDTKMVMKDVCTPRTNRNGQVVGQTCHKEPSCVKKTTKLQELRDENRQQRPKQDSKPKTLQEKKKNK